MKKTFCLILSLCFVVSCAFGISGCSNNASANNAETQATTAKSTTAQSTTESATASNISADDPILGTWKITSGTGSEYTYSYVFNADGTADLALGNVKYIGKFFYTESDTGEKLVSVKLFFGLDGDYTLAFSDDNKTLTLEFEDKTVTSVLTKTDDYVFMPKAPENPEVDSELIGTWKDTNSGNITYTFNENGTMENNNYNQVVTYASISTSNGYIHLSYNMGDDMQDKYKYSVEDGVLTIDNVQFEKA